MSQEAIKVKAAIAHGKQRFFELHPELLLEADAAAEQKAEASSSSLDDLREVARYRVIAAYAKVMKTDSLAMLMELGSDSQDEFQQLITAQNAEIKKSIGM